jgi:hypothetical protein
MKAEIEGMSVTYTQESDGCSPDSNSFQELEIFTEDAGSGKYMVLKTERWAIDSIDEMIEILNDFKLKAEIK